MAEKKVLKMEEIKVGIEKSIKAIAIACKAGKTDDAIKAETNLKALEKQYVEQRTKEVFGELEHVVGIAAFGTIGHGDVVVCIAVLYEVLIDAVTA